MCEMRRAKQITEAKPTPATLLKKTPAQVFSFELCEIFKNTHFVEHLRWVNNIGEQHFEAVSALTKKNTKETNSSKQIITRFSHYYTAWFLKNEVNLISGRYLFGFYVSSIH